MDLHNVDLQEVHGVILYGKIINILIQFNKLIHGNKLVLIEINHKEL